MCIAIFSQIGNEIPTDNILKTCFRNNSDGAGFAFSTDNHKVQIVKGFMDFNSFITAFHEYDKKHCFKDRGVLIHFRITTHGGTNPSNCHPFPISSNSKHLKKLKFVSNYACIHNGIISLTADRKSSLSDTQLFVKDYLTKISSNKGWFYNTKNTELIYELIDSKMAILNGKGEIIATEGFHKGEDGNYYSNDSYKSLYYGLYSWDFEDYYNIFANNREEHELECPLMRLKSNESICYDDGNIENYENGYHNLYSHYVTKDGDIYRQLYLQPNILDLIKQLRKEQQEQAVKIGDLWEDNDRLFTTWCGKPMHPNTTYTWLNRFCKNENIPFKGIHSFRHAVATQAITNGVDIKTVSSILGHSQTSTTLNIYAHAVQKSNVKALNLMADLLQ